MKEASASTSAGVPEANQSSAKKPKSITVEDVARNAELIVKAVESNQTRLTTRAISRLALHSVDKHSVSRYRTFVRFRMFVLELAKYCLHAR